MEALEGSNEALTWREELATLLVSCRRGGLTQLDLTEDKSVRGSAGTSIEVLGPPLVLDADELLVARDLEVVGPPLCWLQDTSAAVPWPDPTRPTFGL